MAGQAAGAAPPLHIVAALSTTCNKLRRPAPGESNLLLQGLAWEGWQGAAMSVLGNIMTSLTGIVKTCDSQLTQQASQTASQQKTQRKGRKKSTSRMLVEHEEGQAAEQPPVDSDKASDAELLRIAFTDGEAAINISRPLQQGQARYPGSAELRQPIADAIASRSCHAVRNPQCR